jgi:hypothetical protein
VSNDESLALADLRRALAEGRKLADRHDATMGALTFDDIAERSLDNRFAPDGEGTLATIVIGERGQLDRAPRRSARAFRDSVRQQPKATLYICVAGYDTDPRDIRDIPEAAAFFRMWARFAASTRSPPLGPHRSRPIASACSAHAGALSDVDPADIGIRPLPSTERH